MKQDVFESKYQNLWVQFDTQLTQLEMSKDREPSEFRGFPRAYRQVCKHLALARDRGYSAHIVDRLNDLALRGHHFLYSDNRVSWAWILVFFTRTFPQLVRKEFRLVLLCSVLFYGPGLALFTAIQLQPNFAYSIMSPEELAQMVEMHHPDLKPDRTLSDDITMFGFYVWHNTGISFRTFASGFFVGIGSLFFLLFNGIQLGCVSGHLANGPASTSFFTFVVGHSAFELTAIVLAAAAGMRLGLALLFPGLRSRLQALKEAGKTAIGMVYGVACMDVIAAVIEAFWSPRIVPDAFKFGFGLASWTLVTLYFLWMGRTSEVRR